MTRPDGLTPDRADSVLIMLVVPRHWRRMSTSEIQRALKHNQPHLLPHLAAEIKRWQGSGVLDLGARLVAAPRGRPSIHDGPRPPRTGRRETGGRR